MPPPPRIWLTWTGTNITGGGAYAAAASITTDLIAPQHRDRNMTTNYYDVTLPYALGYLSWFGSPGKVFDFRMFIQVRSGQVVGSPGQRHLGRVGSRVTSLDRAPPLRCELPRIVWFAHLLSGVTGTIIPTFAAGVQCCSYGDRTLRSVHTTRVHGPWTVWTEL